MEFTYDFDVVFTGNLSAEQQEFFEQCVGYSNRKNFNGEESFVSWQSSRRATVSIDTTKSSRDGVDFLHDLETYLVEGTPVRKTNREGPAGTRLVEPLKNTPKIKYTKGDVETGVEQDGTISGGAVELVLAEPGRKEWKPKTYTVELSLSGSPTLLRGLLDGTLAELKYAVEHGERFTYQGTTFNFGLIPVVTLTLL